MKATPVPDRWLDALIDADDRQLTTLLRSRPDLALPAPGSMAELAQRMVSPNSVDAFYQGADVATRKFLEALCVMGTQVAVSAMGAVLRCDPAKLSPLVERLAATGLVLPADQGTAVYLLDARSDYEAADLLEIASLTYSEGEDAYGNKVLVGDLAVDVALLDSYTHDIRQRIRSALNDVVTATGEDIEYVRAYPRPAPADWREARQQGRLTGINNQGTKLPLPPSHPRKYGLNFRDAAEVQVFEALERLQAALPPENAIAVAPNAVIFVAGKTREIDFLVTYRGRIGAIEVDGDSHRNRYAADQSKDRMLRDAGIEFVERIVAEDANKPGEVDQFVRKFIDRLIAR